MQIQIRGRDTWKRNVPDVERILETTLDALKLKKFIKLGKQNNAAKRGRQKSTTSFFPRDLPNVGLEDGPLAVNSKFVSEDPHKFNISLLAGI